jgi:hypothetical protein
MKKTLKALFSSPIVHRLSGSGRPSSLGLYGLPSSICLMRFAPCAMLLSGLSYALRALRHALRFPAVTQHSKRNTQHSTYRLLPSSQRSGLPSETVFHLPSVFMRPSSERALRAIVHRPSGFTVSHLPLHSDNWQPVTVFITQNSKRNTQHSSQWSPLVHQSVEGPTPSSSHQGFACKLKSAGKSYLLSYGRPPLPHGPRHLNCALMMLA